MRAEVAYVNPQVTPPERDHGNARPSDDRGMADQDLPLITRRLRRLLAHLKITDAEFSERADLKPSYVSRLLSGERGGSGEAPKLFLKTSEVFGVDGRYWSARDDLDPAECIRSAGEEQRSMAKADNAQWRMIQLAAERDAPGDVIKELGRTKAPPGADEFWWFRRYLELLDAHR